MATWIVTDAAPGTGPRVAVKDLIDVAGLPTTAACRAVADRALPAERDAACLAGLRGRIPLGGVRPLAPGLDTVGPMARDVAGVAAGMALLIGPRNGEDRLLAAGSLIEQAVRG